MRTRALAIFATISCAAPAIAHADSHAAIGLLSAEHLEIPDPHGSNATTGFGNGAGLSLLYIELNQNLPAGFEASTLFLGDSDSGRRLFDFGLSLIASAPLGHRSLVPYVKFGIDLAAATIPPLMPTGTPKDKDDSWVSLGVHGAVGVHGFLTKEMFWRAEAGWLGAGVGGLSAMVSIGWTFGSN
jgi:hypothetical protein